MKIENWVSVPLSGLLFLNELIMKLVDRMHIACFRPLIGVIISKLGYPNPFILFFPPFPSPYRGYYF